MSKRPLSRLSAGGRRPVRGRGNSPSNSGGGVFPDRHGWWFDDSTLDLDFQNNLGAINGQSVAGGATGQLTLTRTTAGYAQSTATGLWTSFASGQFRQTDKGLLVEEARTNSLLWCRDMTNAAWVKGATMTAALTQAGIDGSANSATLLTGGAVSGTNTVLQTITLGSAADTYSVFLKRVTGSGVVNISADGSTWTPVTLTTSYQQFQVQQTLANPVCGIQITTNGDQVAADFNQLEPGGFATSPILTTTVAVTRNADQVSMKTPSMLSLSLGTWYAEWNEVVGPISVEGDVLRMRVDSNNVIELTRSSANKANGIVMTASVTQASFSSTNSVVAGSIYRQAMAYNTNDASEAFTTSLQSTVLTDNAVTTPTGVFAVGVGGNPSGTGNQLNGYVRRLVWFPSRVADSILQVWAQGTVGA